MKTHFLKKLKKVYWWLSGLYAFIRYPINNNLTYIGITGTDGKTTTSSFVYEIAKEFGYKPLLLTTVSAKFDDKDIEVHLKSMSFFAYSVKSFLSAVKELNILTAIKNLLFLDKKNYLLLEEEHRTTPLAAEIRKLIREFESKGADFIILETTSHSIDQYRIFGIKYDSIAYTNITNEHLDYHGSWENYADTKSKLMNHLKKDGNVSLNKDDNKSFEFLIDKFNNNKKTKNKNLSLTTYFALEFAKLNNDKFYINFKESENGFSIFATDKKNNDNSQAAKLKLFGEYNIYNALAALSAFLGIYKTNTNSLPFDESFSKGVKALSNLKEVEGRMKFLAEKPKVIVDFAHTPNAMEKALVSASQLKISPESKLWVVFGCAGLRDNYKRPAMGKIAFDNADTILITAEDPRTESLFDINNQIIDGFKKLDEDFIIHSYFENLPYNRESEKFIARFDEPNLNSRKNAIKFAIDNASSDDIIIILGKGHETSIAFGSTEYKWNDIEEVNNLLNK